MGLSFRKRIKLLPGVHLNVGKKGMSVSTGVKGLSITRGNGRTSLSVGIPGTGVSYRTSSTDKRATLDDAAGPAADQPSSQQKAFEAGQRLARIGLLAWIAGFALRFLAVLNGCVAIAGLAQTVSHPEKGLALNVGLILVFCALAFFLWRWGSKILQR